MWKVVNSMGCDCLTTRGGPVRVATFKKKSEAEEFASLMTRINARIDPITGFSYDHNITPNIYTVVPA